MLKVILADNQAIFRAGAARVLAGEEDVRIVAQLQSADQIGGALNRFRNAVLIFSSSFQPDLAAVAAQAKKSHARLVLVADNGEDPSQFLRAGMQGVVFRNVTGPALAECVRTVSRGATWVQGTRGASAAADDNDMVGTRVRDRLTAKELRVVSMIVQGFKNKEIATRLGTTEQVIKNYLRNVYDKVGVSDRLELA
ncbi:MAG: LuxR C-terminal-related transcriptional regulator, partial [Terriglobales bacterium]